MNEKKRKRLNLTKRTMMTIVMLGISILTISISAFAWFLITNTPKVENIELTADTIGTLQIAEDMGDKPGEYSDTLDLKGKNKKNTYLSPVTTKDGLTFFTPVYTENKVTNLKKETQKKVLNTKYVYEKTFYLRAGDDSTKVDKDKAKTYDIYLVGSSADSNNGCFVKQKGTDGKGNEITAANSIRVALTFEGGNSGEKVTVIYEPNADKDNKGVKGKNMAYFDYKGNDSNSEAYGAYGTIQQNYDKSFKPNSNISSRSVVIDTITEGNDIKVTMRIWLEGMDKDCVNQVAADEIIGQIQFGSEERFE
ncbi:MAG: hypothetical protein E7270_07590 [Lachnospiraceae bacterium]|nr:hypothetical protein [Lachnospiraceae bacterium]